MKEKARLHNSRVSPGVRTSTRGQKCTRNAQKQPSPCAQGDAIARGTEDGSGRGLSPAVPRVGAEPWPGSPACSLSWPKGTSTSCWERQAPPPWAFSERSRDACVFTVLYHWSPGEFKDPQVSLRLPVLLVLTSQLKFLVLLRHLKDGEETKG